MIQTFLSRVVTYGRIIDFDVSASVKTIKIELQRGGGQARLVLILRDVCIFGAMMLQVDTTRPLNATSPHSPCQSPYDSEALFYLFWANVDAHMVGFPQTSTDFIQAQIQDPRWISLGPHHKDFGVGDAFVHMTFHDVVLSEQSWVLESIIGAGLVELYIDDVLCSAEKLYKQSLLYEPTLFLRPVNVPPLREPKLCSGDLVGLPDGLKQLFKPTEAWLTFDEMSPVMYHIHEIHDWFIDAKRAYINVRAEQFYHESQVVTLVDVQMTFWALEQWTLYEMYYVMV